MSDLQPEVTTTGEPAAQVNYAALPGDVTSLSDAIQAPVRIYSPRSRRPASRPLR